MPKAKPVSVLACADTDPHEHAQTWAEWCELTGYNPTTREYAETEARDGALPGAHCGVHYVGISGRRVA
jgi:hypothetical protein